MTGFVAALFETEQTCAGYSVEGGPAQWAICLHE
jgi:hypothetical protein